MSRKHFTWLLAITAVVAALVLMVPVKTGKESGLVRTRLLPGLEQKVNDLDWLRFTGVGNATLATLQRAEGQWQVVESGGYRADWNRLRTLLKDLSQAEIVETKTANPEYYNRLGVADVSLPDASGVRIDFGEDSGLPAVIIGQRAQGREGQYARVEGTAESALIDRQLDLPTDATSWLDRSIVDISDAEVVGLDIQHADGERIVASKKSADDENFELQGIPEGREIRSAWTVNSLADGLTALTLEGVAPDSAIDWAGAVHYGLVTADGLRIDAELVAVPAAGGAADDSAGEAGKDETEPASDYWIRLQAGLYQTAVESGVTAPEEDAAAETGKRAEGINQRVSGWAYRIPKYKFDGMTRRMEDLLKALDSPKS